MKTPDRASRIAEHLARAREGGAKVSAEAEGGEPLGADEAYAIQSLLAERFGPAGAFKVACKPSHPVIMAPIYAGDIHASPALFRAEGGERVGIELEVGFKILSPLPAPEESDYEEKLRARVALVPVIEIVTTRLADLEKASLMLRLADNQLNGGLIVGEEVREWQGMDLSSVKAWLKAGTQQLVDGAVAVPGGDAFANFRTLAERVGRHCGGLKPGHVVITGSLNGLPYIHQGMSVAGGIEGIGEVSVEVVF